MNEKPLFNPKKYEKDIIDYKNIREKYELLANYMQALLKLIAKKLDIYPIIQGRAKSIESYAEKIRRPGRNYKDPLNELMDLCGIRFITHTLDEVNKVANILEEYFIIDEKSSDDKMEKLAYREFGYLSHHFTIQLKDIIPIKGFENTAELEQLKPYKAELQLRTLAQHVWADVYHEVGYKNEFQLPSRWLREFARIAATLESCDRGFQGIKDDIVSLESNFGRYMTNEQLKSLAKRLEILCKIDAKNSQAFHRLIKAYAALQKWDIIEDKYNQNKSLVQSNGPALRDIGMAICKNNLNNPKKYREGQSLIKRALKINPKDVEAFCCLGGTYFRQGKLKKAFENYQEAYCIDPTNPYALGNYIACELLMKKDLFIIECCYLPLKEAIKRCKKQIEVNTNLPWAFYDLGLFYLYLKNPYESIKYYAKAINTSPKAWMISSGRSRIDEFIENDIKVESLKMISTFLRAGEWILIEERDKKEDILDYMYGNTFNRVPKQVLILAGGCGGMEQIYFKELNQLKEKLRKYKGTIVSGGTRSGIADIAGELQKNNKNIHTIGYLPHKDSDVVKNLKDKRYKQFRYTTGDDFSILESLTFWQDFLTAGGDPKSVKLIGFNGGRISACEYRIALAFGAKVGIIQNSGREADKLLTDPLWNDYDPKSREYKRDKNLYALDLKSNDIEEFLKK